MCIINDCRLLCIFIIIIGLTVGSYNTDFILRPTAGCSAMQFTCADGQCISKFDTCDGRKDCLDGTDENHVTCQSQTCPRNTFKCAYGACVDGYKKCNGVFDCADKSDEFLLSCPDFNWLLGDYPKCEGYEFQCRNGECINAFLVCDGRPDCRDKSDETVTQCNKNFFQCLPNNFRCAYGACIDNKKKCDELVDCVDGSDENDFLCHRKFIVNEGYWPPTGVPGPDPPQTSIVSPKNGTCYVPSSAGTKYSTSECLDFNDCSAVPKNTVVEENSFLYVNCKEGFARSDDDYSYISCESGVWRPAGLSCVRLCEAITSSAMKTVCTWHNKPISCHKPVRPGTTARSECVQGYISGSSNIYSENTCLDDGKWLNQVQFCTHECGVLPTQALIAWGRNATKTYHPWNVGIYVKSKTSHIHYCGGTLITPFTVLTAAHCTYLSGKRLPVYKFSVGLNKQFITYNDSNDENAQHIEVENIYVSPDYDGDTLRFYSDIALFELKESANLNSGIRPACIDFSNKYSIDNTTNGTVVGWGFDESDEQPNLLQRADVPYISNEECTPMVEETSHFLPRDKFCAFFRDSKVSNTSVEEGDSGSGYVVLKGNKYYIFGLVSSKIAGRIRTFTDVKFHKHLEFINDVSQNITRKHL